MKKEKSLWESLWLKFFLPFCCLRFEKNAELPFYDKTYILLIFIPVVVAAAVVAEIVVAVAKLDGS